MSGPEFNPQDDVQPTKEEYEAWERSNAAKCPHCPDGRITVEGDGCLWCDSCEINKEKVL